MAKKLDLSKNVFELTTQYPELIDIMAELGFSEIKNKAVRTSVGRMMTIPRGAKMKGINIADVVAKLMDAGFDLNVSDSTTDETEDANKTTTTNETKEEGGDRTELLKSYLRRLTDGEDLATVRKDFVKNFKGVEATEIMDAEQQLLDEGAPLNQVQQLCDIHSALFHGATAEEQRANMLRDEQESAERRLYRRYGISDPEQHRLEEAHAMAQAQENVDKAGVLRNIEGHPLNTFYRENDELERRLNALAALFPQLEQAVAARKGALHQKITDEIIAGLKGIGTLAVHYAKKGDLIFPLLKVKYNVPGPSQVMWTLDDEIRADLSKLNAKFERTEEWYTKAQRTVQRALEMVYKENNILFPLCAANFSDDDWKHLYQDSKDYDVCFDVKPVVWQDGESFNNQEVSASDRIQLPGGSFTLGELRALLNSLPFEVTFVDANDINRFFNEGPKLFKRPTSALGREVYSCHPPKIEPMVRAIISDFRQGKRDEVPVWMVKNGHEVLVRYMAVRDHEGQYVGTMEIVQDMEFARKHYTK